MDYLAQVSAVFEPQSKAPTKLVDMSGAMDTRYSKTMKTRNGDVPVGRFGSS